MSDFKWFKSTVTGKSGEYPAHFASNPDFVEISPEDGTCLDCLGGMTEDEFLELVYPVKPLDDPDDSRTEDE